MSALPGDTPQGRPGLPPLGPALSRPGTPAPAPAPGAGSALPPFAPFARPAEQGADEPAAAPTPVHPFTQSPESPQSPAEADAHPMPWEAAPSAVSEPEPEPEPVLAEAQEEDFPWLSPEPADEPAAPAAEGAGAARAGTEELPDWLSWVDMGDEPAAAEPAAEALASVALAAEEAPVETPAPAAEWEIPGVADFLAGEEAAAADEALSGAASPEEAPAAAAPEAAVPAAEIPVGADATPGGAPGVDRAFSGALDGVADRLEQIARALRERPEEVLSGGAGSDPLQLLVTGFVLGYAQGQGRSGG